MKNFAQVLTLAIILTTLGTSSTQAQSVGSLGDWMNDYELYVADWKTNWYTVVTWDNGSVSEYRSSSQSGAQQWATWLYLHIVEVEDIDIVSREELSEWEYIDTYGTYLQASAAAAEYESFGYETDIRSIQVNSIEATTYRPSLRYAPKIYPTLSTK